MHLSARPKKTTSTCPLCLTKVRRREGVRCKTCRAITHASCVHELGPCHGPSARRRSEDPAPHRGGKSRLEFLREERDRAMRIERERQREAREKEKRTTWPAEWDMVAAAILGVVLVGGCVQTLVRWDGKVAFCFAFMAALMSGALREVWRGFTRGKIETAVHRSKKIYDSQEQPLRFLASLIAWAAMALICGSAAGYMYLHGPA